MRFIDLILGSAAAAQAVPALPPAEVPAGLPSLVAPRSRQPVTASLDDDPILRLGAQGAAPGPLAEAARAAVARAPLTAEALAAAQEAGGALAEARSVRSPSVDAAITRYDVIDRRIGNPENIIERSRPRARTDLLLTVDQLLMDAGGASNRIGAAVQRTRAAEQDLAGTQDRVALDVVGAWYEVFTYRALADLSDGFVRSQGDIRTSVNERIKRGASAEAELARVESYVASARGRTAAFRRRLAQAEARYETLTGAPAPAGLTRVAAPATPISRDLAVRRSTQIPAVLAARAAAEAAEREAKAARADTLPVLTGGIEAGRYGIYETPRDYDVRGRVTIRQRLFGGIDARADQARARAAGADARAARAEQDAARDATVAWSDIALLEEQERAQRDAYVAARRTRDAVAERFRLSSGTLFDVLVSEDAYFQTAAAYVQAVTDLDAARWSLLSRTGTLLSTLGVSTPPRSYRP